MLFLASLSAPPFASAFCCPRGSDISCEPRCSRGKRSEEPLAVKDSGSGGSLAPRVVTMKVYVGLDIWEFTGKEVDTNLRQFMVDSLEKLFTIVNQHLSHLDNGGYFVQFDKTVHSLKTSDVKIGKTYIDRLDSNTTKTFNQSDIFSHTFTFQEAVQQMKGRMNVNVRLLVIPGEILDSEEKATAEEHCVCEPDWFGCIIVLSIGDKHNWSKSASMLTHEFGHVLGAVVHDDKFYPSERAEELIMWSKVNPESTVWSDKARKTIKKHDNSCMERKVEVKS